MNLIQPKSLVIGVAMLAAAGAAIAMKPTERMADTRGKTALDAVIPMSFKDWRIDSTVVPIQPSPDVQAELDKVYDQILARTYVNSAGDRVMLSIAYGGAQSKALQVHRPEVCYVAQGFRIRSMQKSDLPLSSGAIPAMRLEAQLGQRNEPITYWVRMGDTVVRGNVEQGLARLTYGLTGRIPDGLLFRVSSISTDPAKAFSVQDQFIRDLLSSLSPETKPYLVGSVL